MKRLLIILFVIAASLLQAQNPQFNPQVENPRPGDCFEKIWEPAITEQDCQNYEKEPAYSTYEVIPAEFSEEIVPFKVKENLSRWEEIGGKMCFVEYQKGETVDLVMRKVIKPAHVKETVVPAVVETICREVVKSPGRYVFKRTCD